MVARERLIARVLLSAQRALTGEIAPTLLAYSFAVDPERSRIRLRAHYSEPPDEDEIDRIRAVDTEICADFPPPFQTATDWEIAEPGKALAFLPDGVAFLRDDAR